MAVLPVILIKSTLLAVFTSLAASRFQKAGILHLVAVVLAYQVVGMFIEWAIVKDAHVALQDFRMAVPGLLLQVFGGWLFINHIIRK
ncbi:MAG: hypothetical protein ACK5L5_00970 [Bacteroidales bacterium]